MWKITIKIPSQISLKILNSQEFRIWKKTKSIAHFHSTYVYYQESNNGRVEVILYRISALDASILEGFPIN